MKGRVDFYEREVVCESRFNESGDCWHLCTPGHLTEILFTCTRDFSYGMLLMGIAADRFPTVHIFTFELMSNHVHIILSGTDKCCKDFFTFFKKRLKRFFTSTGRDVDLSQFEAELIPIQDLNAMRNEIVYVNRNGYLTSSDYTFFSYPWGAGAYFFNSFYKLFRGMKFNSLGTRLRRELLHSRDLDVSDKLIFIPLSWNNNGELIHCCSEEWPKKNLKNISRGDSSYDSGRESVDISVDNSREYVNDADRNNIVHGGIFLPTCFCDIQRAESFFRDSHHYCDLLTKNFEAYSQIAQRLGDRSIISDAEVYSAAVSLSLRKFNVRKISSLNLNEKIDIARIMHNEYRTTGKQLQRILKLDPSIIDTLYPQVEQ